MKKIKINGTEYDIAIAADGEYTDFGVKVGKSTEAYLNENGEVVYCSDGISSDTVYAYIINTWIDENGETVDISKLKVQVSIQPDDIEMSDEAEAGLVSGEIINLIYKGDHYSYVVRTEYGYDLIVDDEYLWNMNDKVSLVMPEDKMKFQLKK